MIRDVMLALTDTPADETALDAAAALAESAGARLSIALPLESPPVACAAYGVTPVMIESTMTALWETAQARAERLRAQLKCREVALDVHISETHEFGVRHLLALEARYADIVVIAAAGAEANDPEVVHEAFATLLFESGRPVLVIPRNWDGGFPVQRSVVAWTPTREASRALHDALQLLAPGTRTDVLVISPTIGDRGHGPEPGADVGAHLARHGLSVNVEVRQAARGTVADEILLSAVELGDDLIVAGAYGHSRAREWAFGGTTRELLWRSHVPVLFAH